MEVHSNFSILVFQTLATPIIWLLKMVKWCSSTVFAILLSRHCPGIHASFGLLSVATYMKQMTLQKLFKKASKPCTLLGTTTPTPSPSPLPELSFEDPPSTPTPAKMLIMKMFNVYIRSKTEYLHVTCLATKQAEINWLERIQKQFTSKIE